MKKIILIALLATLASFIQPVSAQCTFSGAGVKLNGSTYTDPVTGKCMINIDLYFDLESNAGSKYVYIHIWPASLYPSYNYANPPVAANLVNTVATLGFYHFGGSLYMLDRYTPDPGIDNFKYSGLTITKSPGSVPGYDRFVISNLLIASPASCSIPQSFIADAWGSQSSNAQNIHCFSKGLNFYANDPKVTGLLFCQAPRTYRFDITTINTGGMTVNYEVFIDNGDGIFNRTTDTITIATASAIQLDNTNGYKFSSPMMSYLPYAEQKPYSDRAIWIVVTSPALSNEMYARLDNTCIPLPVNFTSFTAMRNKAVVELKWTTATENDNMGFFIQRKHSGGDWEIAGFVPTLAAEGNSQEMLGYTFSDNNIITAVTEYRLQQRDINGKISYSAVRFVKGYGQSKEMTVYPNPSGSGRVNVLFEKTDYPFTIELLDMSGKLLKKWSCYNQSQLVLVNMRPGVYILKVWIPGTQELLTEKFIINR